MIPFEAYKVIHIVGVMLLLLSLGGYLTLSMSGSDRGKRLAAVTHGISVVIILVAGFGLLARMGFFGAEGWPMWVWLKLLIWLILTVIILPIRKMPTLAPMLWILVPVLSGLAAFFAVYKF